MNADSRPYISGHRGMVGSALCRALAAAGLPEPITFTSSELDLRDQAAVRAMMERERPTHVFVAAAKVGGIHANNVYRADFLYDNLMIEANLIHAAHQVGVEKLLFLGSSCIYPKLADQPLVEDALLTGALEPTNEPYAIAKIAGIKLCEAYRDQHGANFISAMPTNLYGPGDNYDLQNSHVVPALIRKFHEAKVNGDPTVTCWGTGSPRREFLHVDDLAEACLFLMEEYDGKAFVNVGTGSDMSINELAELIRRIVGYEGDIVWDTDKPDGTPRKLMNCDRIHALGWTHRIGLEEGLRSVYEEYRRNPDSARAK
ncbi:MAG: GDP-L-fucose synthase [Bacteroidota bacterium]|nr:GDP-L-fucose synthase [Bacteroidota bacterium]MEC8759380.1 GDP-L-fucose synthase [Bacteroidota bacterium]